MRPAEVQGVQASDPLSLLRVQRRMRAKLFSLTRKPCTNQPGCAFQWPRPCASRMLARTGMGAQHARVRWQNSYKMHHSAVLARLTSLARLGCPCASIHQLFVATVYPLSLSRCFLSPPSLFSRALKSARVRRVPERSLIHIERVPKKQSPALRARTK